MYFRINFSFKFFTKQFIYGFNKFINVKWFDNNFISTVFHSCKHIALIYITAKNYNRNIFYFINYFRE